MYYVPQDFVEIFGYAKICHCMRDFFLSFPQGFEQIAFSLMEKCISVSLISDGAEAVLINKKFFLQHLTDDMSKKLRTTV